MAQKILILTAHPDDAEFMAGGTIAKLAHEGNEIYEVIATNGARGSFELDRDTLIKLRRKEAEEAGKILGKREVFFLGYEDGYLGDVPINELRERFIYWIRRIKPNKVFSWDFWARFEFHPDHRAVARAVTEALAFSHMPLYHPEHKEEGLEPHLVAECFFFAKSAELCNIVVDITAYMGRKIEALCAHDSQMKLTLDELKMDLKAIGADESMLANIDRSNYKPAVELMVKAMAQSVGKKAGFEFGEEFRHETAGGEVARQVFEMLKR